MSDTTTQTTEWAVANLDCPSCAAGLQDACSRVPGVAEVAVNVATGRIRVRYDATEFDLGRLAAAARRAGHPLQQADEPRPARGSGWVILGAVALAIGLVIELLTGERNLAYLVAALAGVVPLLPQVWDSLHRRRVDMNVLMAVAMSGAVGLGEWREAAVLAVLFALALWLERASLAKTGQAVRALLDQAPRTARVEHDGEVVELPLEEVPVGARVRVRPGDLIPLDGVILEGRSGIDEAAVTGESVPASKGPGESVYAATLALDGALTIEVTETSENSTVARVVALIESAEATPSPTARVVDRFAAWYTPTIVLLAVGTMILGRLVGLPLHEAVYRGLVLLVIGCPCAIVIATPVAIFCGVAAAARQGVLVKGGEPLEAIAQVTTVAFDKTGTLTRGRPRVVDVVPLGGLDRAEALRLAAGLEADSSHPLGLALRDAAAAEGLVAAAVADHQAEPGMGVSGTVDGRSYRLGHRRFLAAHDLSTEGLDDVGRLEAEGCTTLVLAADQPLAVFGLADQPREQARAAVDELRQEGVSQVLMLTGDNARAARSLGDQVGIGEIRAGLLPQDKQRVISELVARGGVVAMVGDGINDGPALAAATVGIAVAAAGSDLALETADIALLGEDLRALPALLRLARRVRRTIAANIVIAVLIRVLLVPLAVTGHAGLALAILGDMGGSLVVTGNSLRLLRSGR